MTFELSKMPEFKCFVLQTGNYVPKLNVRIDFTSDYNLDENISLLSFVKLPFMAKYTILSSDRKVVCSRIEFSLRKNQKFSK